MEKPGDHHGKMPAYAYHSTEDGWPDYSRPMTSPEMVQLYWDAVDLNPDMLADLYINFHQFNRIEFLVFRDRLSASILVAHSSRPSINEIKTQFERKKIDGSHRVEGWEAESDDALDDHIHIIENAQEISIGATMLASVAALEGLVQDLAPDGVKPDKGLTKEVNAFLHRQQATQDEIDGVMVLVKKVAKRRNDFAHTLIGSYWATEDAGYKFDVATMHDTLFTVGEIAIALESFLDN